MKSLAAGFFLLVPAGLSAAPPFELPEPIDGAHGTEMRLFAKEPFLRNTVAVAVGEDGRVYATSVLRRKAADLDIRQFRDWIEKDLSLRTVGEKRAFLRNELTAENSQRYRRVKDQNDDGVIDWRDLTVLTDRIVVLEDSDGDGVADRADSFAEGFNTEVTGIAAGLEVWDGEVYATVEPDLLRLRDTGGSPTADQREVLATGFSVRLAYAGHNFSGPVMGPDGRLYMSSTDKGMHVTSKEGQTFSHPLSGTIARCEPDGSNFEVFAYGLRNAQEPAFDQFGNLFAIDNDGDMKGEKERLVYLTPGSDHGWRYHWQYRGSKYQPWMVEGLSKPDHPGRPAYSTPPLQLYHDGPAGFAFNPGTALNPHYANHFFMSGFPARKLHAFQLRSKGASFEMVGDHVVARGPLMVGLDFSPDGALYVADWSARGYELNEKGGLWKLDDPKFRESKLRRQTAGLLRADWTEPTPKQLLDLLAHPDQRVRMKAQFELVRRRDKDSLQKVALDRSQPELARLHAIWGLGQNRRLHGIGWGGALETLYGGPDAEVRAQALRVAGDSGSPQTVDGGEIAPLLKDPAARPRFFAAISLGRLREKEAFPELVAYLARDGGDPYHRHAGVMGLVGCGSPVQLGGLVSHPSVSVRLAAVVALRRLRSPVVADFLKDEDSLVVTEAVRAIYDDRSIPAALPQVAALLDQPVDLNEAVLRRALAAAQRLRTSEQAVRVVRVAANEAVDPNLRQAALGLLKEWLQPDKLDPVQGRYRELPGVPVADLAGALQPLLAPLLNIGNEDLRQAALAVGRVYGLGSDPADLLALVKKDDPKRSPDALRLLAEVPEQQRKAALIALESPHPSVRAAALAVFSRLEPASFIERARKVLAESKSLPDRRAALIGLPSGPDQAVTELLLGALQDLQKGALPPALALELFDAMRRSEDPVLPKALRDHLARLPDEALAPYAGTLHGGDAIRGKDIFNNHVAAQCIRCHAVGPGGSEVGPNLAGIGKKDPDYLLAALVDPGRDLAPGFQVTNLVLRNGGSETGTLIEENEKEITLRLPSGERRVVAADVVTGRFEAGSAMPPMGALLSKTELRDILAYLQSLD